MSADEDLDRDLEAFIDAMAMDHPVWTEGPTKLSWLAHDPMSGFRLTLELHPTRGFHLPCWVAFATNSEGETSQGVRLWPSLDASICAAENSAARGQFKFLTNPTQEHHP